MPPSGAREGVISREYGCFCLGREYPINREKMWRVPLYNEKIFFGGKIPPVESGRAPTHHASVPQKEGEQVEYTKKQFKSRHRNYFFLYSLTPRVSIYLRETYPPANGRRVIHSAGGFVCATNEHTLGCGLVCVRCGTRIL